jgi:hypothetical protein
MPSDVDQFQRDLLESVEQMRRGQATRVTEVKLRPRLRLVRVSA